MIGYKGVYRSGILLSTTVTLSIMFVWMPKIFAADTLNIPVNIVNNTSPSDEQSNEVDAADAPWHTLILSDHGRVESVKVGMYFESKQDQSFSINVDNGRCAINGNSTYPKSKDYIVIRYGSEDPIMVNGDQICGWLDGHSFTIKSGDLTANWRSTGLYGLPVTISWVTNDDIVCKPSFCPIRNYLAGMRGGEGSYFRFRFKMGNASDRVGLIDTQGLNNSISHSASGNNRDVFTDIYYPFGMRCNADAVDTQTNAPVTLYDADQGEDYQKPAPINFFVGTVDTNGKVTPLEENEYKHASGKLQIDDTGRNPTAKWTHPDGYPQIYPGGYNNKGGSTTVYIKEMRSDKKYVLIVKNLHGNQFIYIGLPGDSIYGSPDFHCQTGNTGTLECRTLSLDPADMIDPSTNINANFTVKRTGSFDPPSDYKMTLGVTGPGGSTTSRYSQTRTVPASTALPHTESYPIPPIGSVGSYNVKATVDYADGSGNAASDDCATTMVVALRPYFSVLGGDLYSAGVQSWNIDGNGGSYAGAGSQLAVLSSGNIANYVTGRGLSLPGVGTGLAFANVGAPGAGDYGGGFTPLPPVRDYAAEALIGAQPKSTAVPLDPNLLDNGIYVYDQNVTLSGTVMQPGKRVTIVLTSGHDVFISGNSTYAPYALDTIPRLNIYLQAGDIYVGADVAELHGFFVAGKGASRGGTLYSCSQSNGTAFQSVDLLASGSYNTCSQHQLVIFGAVQAKDLDLGRTFGNVRVAGTISGEPAEKFVYTPELWLATGGTSKYNSYISLPPIL